MEKIFDVKLFFILLFLGWFGIDKLYKKKLENVFSKISNSFCFDWHNLEHLWHCYVLPKKLWSKSFWIIIAIFQV